jgi:DNA-binding IscR family transcriptional regulator
MKRDSRLSGVLHVLLHMAERGVPVTSEMLAKPMGTNTVVIRRIMAGLRKQGYVQSEKGHGGGMLACDLSKVTLGDIYAALGSPSLLAIGNRTDRCSSLKPILLSTGKIKLSRPPRIGVIKEERLGDVDVGHAAVLNVVQPYFCTDFVPLACF